MQIPNYNYDKRRFETFIDAVIAIILTILVLELRIPETAHSEGRARKAQADRDQGGVVGRQRLTARRLKNSAYGSEPIAGDAWH